MLLFAVLVACGKSDSAPHEEIPSPPPAARTELPAPRLFEISDSYLRVGPGYRLNLLVDAEWTSFFAELPSDDLTGFESTLVTGAGFRASLVCLNQDCSHSNVDVTHEEKTSSFVFRSQKMRAIAGELQRDCEVPIFFDYELERIFAQLPQVELDLQYLRELKPIRVTHVKSKTWNGDEKESLRAEMAVDDTTFELADDRMPKKLHRLKAKGATPLYAKTFSYGWSGEGSGQMLTYIRAHYPWKGDGSMKELCYQTHFIPELLEGAKAK